MTRRGVLLALLACGVGCPAAPQQQEGPNVTVRSPSAERASVRVPRVAGKLAWMAVETMVARQLTYHAAREKDSDRRCDIEAGMAKLLAARVAWANADNALQVHGGNGYAEEYPISRYVVDAQVLPIFEGVKPILELKVIARNLFA